MPNSTTLDVHWYDFLEEGSSAFFGAMSVMRAQANETAPLSPLLAVRSGYAESPGWFMVQAAEFEPEPLTVHTLRVRDIYASERIVQSLLELLASEKWFDRNARDEYALTSAGREMLTRIFARRRGWLEKIGVGMADTIAHVEATLCALIEVSTATEHAWCVQHSRRRAHLQEISPLAKIFQYLEDFNAFRDDAHMAAWQPLGIMGNEWEAFAFVSDDRARNAESLFDQLYYRGYTRAEYAHALNALAWRGWLEREQGDDYRVTAQGREMCQEAERKTDEYFFAPWQTLSGDAVLHLRSNLETLRNALLAVAS